MSSDAPRRSVRLQSAPLAPRCLPKRTQGRRRESLSSPALLRESAQRQSLRILEVALARHEIHFEADAVRILEQDRVVARRPRAFARRTHDLHRPRAQKLVDCIYVLARASTKADVVQADAALIEHGVAVLGRTADNRDRRATAHPVYELGGLDSLRDTH